MAFEPFTADVNNRLSQKQPVAIYSIDLDNFGVINKKAGRAVGDAILKGIGEFLNPTTPSTLFRQEASVARASHAGDEFYVAASLNQRKGESFTRQVMQTKLDSALTRISKVLNAFLNASDTPADTQRPPDLIDTIRNMEAVKIFGEDKLRTVLRDTHFGASLGGVLSKPNETSEAVLIRADTEMQEDKDRRKLAFRLPDNPKDATQHQDQEST